MTSLVRYVLEEAKEQRLTEAEAVELLLSLKPDRQTESATLHPLVQRNTSDVDQQRFSSRFSGNEFFIRDHVIDGSHVLPAVAYFEIAQQAVWRSVPGAEPVRVELEDVRLTRPLVVGDQGVELHVTVARCDERALEFEIASRPEMEPLIHATGRARLLPPGETRWSQPPTLRGPMAEVAAGACYARFLDAGLAYGPAFRVLERIRVGVDERGQRVVLAEARLPDCVRNTRGAYLLHPSLLDGAVQSSIGLLDAGAQPAAFRAVPVAAQRVSVLAELPERVQVVARARDDLAAGEICKVDLVLADERGGVCAIIDGLAYRAWRQSSTANDVILVAPRWKSEPLLPQKQPPSAGAHSIVMCATDRALPGAVAAALPNARVVPLEVRSASPDVRYLECAASLLAEVRSVLSRSDGTATLLQVVVSESLPDLTLTGLAAMLATASSEHPRLATQLVAVDPTTSVAEQAARVQAEVASTAPLVRYANGQRQVVRFEELLEPATSDRPWKDGGVYLVTGGAGGLGLIFAEAIAAETRGATLVLVGRSESPKRAAFERIDRHGGRLEYRALDVADAASVRQLVQSIVAEYGGLNGVIHAAGVLRDSVILHKTEADLSRVLAPKVTGLVCLDEATADCELDFFVCFSSVSGLAGNVGQADYAAGNAFMDAYADLRDALVRQGRRHGRTLSVAWPLWAEGGMRVLDGALLASLERTGFAPLETAAGVARLRQALSLEEPRVAVLAGDAPRIRRWLAAAERRQPSTSARSASPSVGDDELEDEVGRYLTKLLERSLGLAGERIDVRAPLERYGINSVMIMELTDVLETTFGPLPKTLFFEYQSIERLSSYFCREHRAELERVLRPPRAQPERSDGAVRADLLALPDANGRPRAGRRPAAPQQQVAAHGSLAIAIIGLSGRYPKAANIDEYWANLVRGVDCISEVPSERWDHRRYFDSEKGKLGKSYCKWGGFIDDVDRFDPMFFNISPRDAEWMDPQERLFLECAHSAIEDAGYTRKSLGRGNGGGSEAGEVGVFVGVMYQEYQLYGARAQALGPGFALSGNSSSVANRVSHFCNFVGPSLAVDTMCSSSLTALHLACQSLAQGECRVAIAGGVNVTIHPNKYLALAQGYFASSQGRCKSFGVGGDGYVPGEGVGAVVLKPLRDAIADGDHVYGVIRATAINHGGKTNGYSVPNPNAQAEVIERALKRAGVHPRAVGYVEAHGTGTALGDPIEVAGLSKAFRAGTEERQYCALGSAKSNIGHCESAAGIAGLTKILLQMRHRMLVKSLHTEALNPYIDFASTPFFVQRENAEWQCPRLNLDGQERRYPRLAGLSSFGAGGANAHVIIEEFDDAAVVEDRAAAPIPALVVLSAKDEERLREYVNRLLGAIRARRFGDVELSDLAYTLQVGREAMECRLGCLVESVAALEHKLAAFLDGAAGHDDFVRGDAKKKDAHTAWMADEDVASLVRGWAARGKWSKLLEAWASGLAVDWELLYGERRPRRVSLPTYPFARERYWAGGSTMSGLAGSTPGPSAPRLHPLLHANTSDFEGVRYSVRLSGEEFFLADHVVQGRCVLPGAAYLELARAALVQARPGTEPGAAVRLTDVVFERPIVFEAEPVDVHVGLERASDGSVAFQVYTENLGERRVHAKGRAVVSAVESTSPVDIETIRQALSASSATAEECYASFEAVGVCYGPAFRALEAVRWRDGEVLAHLRLPASVAASAMEYVLHPSLLDGALQSAIGFQLADPRLPRGARVLFEVGALEVRSAVGTEAYAWARSSHAGEAELDRALDIDVYNLDGTLCVRIEGARYRSYGNRSAGASAQPVAEPGTGEVVLAPVWRQVAFTNGPALVGPPDLILGATDLQRRALLQQWPAARVVALPPAANADTMAEALRGIEPSMHILWVLPAEAADELDADRVLHLQEDGVLRAFRLVQALFALGYATSPLNLTIVTEQVTSVNGEPSWPPHAAVHGFAGSLAKELPNWKVRLLDLPAGDWPISELLSVPASPKGEPLAHRDGVWHERELLACDLGGPAPAPTFRRHGVYVLIGGSGGVGALLSEHLIRAYQAKLVWIGRRPAELVEEARKRLGAMGPEPLYVQADASDARALEAAYRQIKSAFPEIHGLVVSVVGPLDDGLANMTEERFKAGLAAKIDASVLAATVFGRERLESVLFFSSLASFEKPGGMSSYAAGSVFQDAFAAWLRRSSSARVKVVNWGYWGEVGIGSAIPSAFKARLRLGGSEPIDPAAAAETLERLLGSSVHQIAYLNTSSSEPARALGVRSDERLVGAASLPEILPLLELPRAPEPSALALEAAAPQPALDALLRQWLLVSLRELGFSDEPGFDVRSWIRTAPVPRSYARWLERSLAFFSLPEGPDGASRMPAAQATDPARLRREWQAYRDAHRHGGVASRVALLDVTLPALTAVLRSERAATELMFPGGSPALVEAVYKNPVSSYFNEVLGETLVRYVESRLRAEPGAGIRVLEIGAGTGATSTVLFAKLERFAGSIAEYSYTDLSNAFLDRARDEHAAKIPHLVTRVFDVERAPSAQGFELGSYDVVVATNVLHATRDIRRSLRHAKALLKGQGLLLVNEIEENSLFTHLTFGLLEGWWRFEDETLRLPGGPALSPEAWRCALHGEGFGVVRFATVPAHMSGQQVIAAQSDGTIRAELELAGSAAGPERVSIATASHRVVSVGEHGATSDLYERTLAYIKKLVAESLRLAPERLDSSEPLEKYGFDSILVVQITSRLRSVLGDVSSTLLFGNTTLEAAARQLVETHGDALRTYFGAGAESQSAPIPPVNHVASGVSGGSATGVPPRAGTASRPTNGGPRESSSAGTTRGRGGIAIIGLSGRYPNAADLDTFWRRLRDAESCIREIPPERWDWRERYSEVKGRPDTHYTKWGGFIDEVDRFDPLFFNIAPREAVSMDPQERLFLEQAYAAIEDAGYTPDGLCPSRQVGVFVGVTNSTYQRRVAYWSIANRVSFVFGFEGPSLAVDTACSASLSAIHLACESLWNHTVHCAIAGGVNLVLDPGHYLDLSAMNMLSSGPECRAFGACADGFVDAEGVGVVLLKPFDQALADGDRIYGVIRASAIGHGGRTNGYTVPSPKAQARVIARALEHGGIDPRAITYVEAHGTGTALGDPIEIAGLAEAFASRGGNRGCAIGSVKTNIGHAESAAGIAGLTKVLLQMQHGVLVQNLNCAELNPEIDFSKTPFLVQRENAPWKRPLLNLDGHEREYPRLAGISSFGAGGSNAHLIVEEYIATSRLGAGRTSAAAIVLLSARDGDRLRQQAERLLRAIDERGLGDDDLDDIAYTLQVGRQALDVRFACRVETIEELRCAVSAFLDGRRAGNIYLGEVKRSADGHAWFTADEGLQATAEAWVAQGKFSKLLELWVNGFVFDWRRLYGAVTPRRIGLPTYPFARERYWNDFEQERRSRSTRARASSGDSPFGPTAEQLDGRRFAVSLSGDEAFLRDHQIAGTPVLPAAAQLELFYATFSRVLRLRDPEAMPILERVAFLSPVMVSAPRELELSVTDASDGLLECTLSGVEPSSGELRSYGKAFARNGRAGSAPWLAVEPPSADSALQRLDSSECYAAFERAGIVYGRSFRGLERVELWHDARGCVALSGRVRSVAGTSSAAGHTLKPASLDAALQTTLVAWLATPAAVASELPLPLSIDSVRVFAPLDGREALRVSATSDTALESGRAKFDVDIADESGRVLVRLEGFAARLPGASAQSAVSSANPQGADRERELVLVPAWQPAPASNSELWPDRDAEIVVVGAEPKEAAEIRVLYPRARCIEVTSLDDVVTIQRKLDAETPLEHWVWLVPRAAGSAGGAEPVRLGLRCVKALLGCGYGSRRLGMTVVTRGAHTLTSDSAVEPAHAAVHGFIGSLAKEYPSWAIRLLDCPPQERCPWSELFTQPHDARGDGLVHYLGQWHQRRLLPCDLPPPTRQIFRAGGVYVVIGGAGGIGEAFSAHVVRRYRAQLVWIGRRPLDGAIVEKQRRVGGATGPVPHYISADARDHAALEQAYREIRARFGDIHGVVHATLVLRDLSLARMDEPAFFESFEAKALVSENLVRVFGREELDFVLFFSALQSFIRAPGQSNYAAGCTFVDAYADLMRRSFSCPVKVVNWGYWGTVGVVASADYRKRMLKLGLGSIEPDAAMLTIESVLASPLEQVAYLKTGGPALADVIRYLMATEPLRIGQSAPSVLPQLAAHTACVLPEQEVVEFESWAGEFEQVLITVLGVRLGEHGWLEPHASPASSVLSRWLKQSRRLLGERGLLDAAEHSPQARRAASLAWDQFRIRGAADPRRRAYVELADHCLGALPAVLRGDMAATEAVFPEGSVRLVDGVYKHNPVADFFNLVVAEALERYAEARRGAEPSARLRLIEIGAGTGGTTAVALERLARFAPQIEEYRYTDRSPVFLRHAERSYRAVAPYLSTSLFDVELPPSTQGLELGVYDVVIAANVLHATTDMRRTLGNAKALLKAGGVLLLGEVTSPSLFTHVTFGLLDGWWSFEDAPLRIPGSPALSPVTWRALLASEGFSAIRFPAETWQRLGHQVIAAESNGLIRERDVQRSRGVVAMLAEHRDDDSRTLLGDGASSGADALDSREAHIRSTVRRSVADAIELDERRIKDDRAFADYGVDSILAVGLINTINERLGTSLSTTALFDYGTVQQLVEHLVRTKGIVGPQRSAPATRGVNGANGAAVPAPNATLERAATNMPDAACDIQVASVSVRSSDCYHRVRLDRPSRVEELRIVEERIRRPGAREVLIGVDAFSLNFGDLLCARGLYPGMPAYPFTPGVELSGRVVDVGSDVRRVQPGDQVIALTGGSFGAHATAFVCPERQVFPLPAGLSPEQGCALPAAGLTALVALRRAGLRKGESVLIQTAAGGTGLMAVQLAQHVGAEIYATAGSRRKLDYLGSLGVEHLINYLETDFAEEVQRLTRGRGVDVVVNTLSGDAVQKGIRSLAPSGRYVEIAMAALKSLRSVDLSSMSSNQAFISVDLRRLFEEQPEVLEERLHELMHLYGQGAIRPTIARAFSFPDVVAAYQHIEQRNNIGKVVVTVPSEYRFGALQAGDTVELAETPARPEERSSHVAPSAVPPPIAVIGMSGRFPKSQDVHELWEHLAKGRDLTTDLQRWPLPAELELDPCSCRRGGFIEDIDCFDPLFFNISGLEATYMDPQQRLFLEEAWRALEDAGQIGPRLAGARCGVYVGCTAGDYQQLLDADAPAQALWGNIGSVVAARIAYHLDLQGPAVAVDTACSSSLVALHLACQALRLGELELCLAGGVFVQSTPGFYRLANRAGMLSASGRCYAFDARADGFVPGEGVGVLVLKRLSDAIRDGDHVYGVIRGSGVNQDGATNGLTAPSARSQERLEREVYATFGIDPAEIQLVEAHGTGTKLGDPIEFRALASAFGRGRGSHECAIGSIKTNIGHAVSAAGIAGVIKVLLALRHRQLPPSLHFAEPNPHIDFENSPFYVNTELRTWEVPPGAKRLAAVSSFGLSGTNAHLVIEEPPPVPEPRPPARGAYLIALSARSAEQLRRQVEQLHEYCNGTPADCASISYTLLTGRRQFAHRLACVVGSTEELSNVLGRWLATGTAPGLFAGVRVDTASDGPALRRAADRCVEACRAQTEPALHREQLVAVAELFTGGQMIDFELLFLDGTYRRVPLPTYPFSKQRYWVGNAERTAERSAEVQPSTLRPAREAQPSLESRVQDFMIRTLAEALYLSREEIAIHAPLSDYGVDSVLGMKLIRRLEDEFSLNMTGRELLEFPTVEALARYLASRAPRVTPVTEMGADADDWISDEQLRAFKDGSLGLEQIKAIIEQRSGT